MNAQVPGRIGAVGMSQGSFTSLALRVLGLIARLSLVALAGGIGATIALAWSWSRSLPDINALDGLRFRAGTERPTAWPPPSTSGTRFDDAPVSLSGVSRPALAAIVSSEDRRFYEHPGFDPIGLARSLLETALGHRQGGSTITAQLVRSTILAPQESLKRKVQELLLSNQVEQRLSKDEILSAYLNTVYWGGHLYGLRAAARAYFGKTPSELTLAEGVYLAALLPAPNARSRDFRSVREHDMRSRLERLVQDGRITRVQANAAWLERLQPRGWRVAYAARGRLVSATAVEARP